MTTEESQPETPLTEVLDECNIASQPADALRDRFGTESELVAFLTDDRALSEIECVGMQTAAAIGDWFTDEHPDKHRQQMIGSEAYCTDFTLSEQPDKSGPQDIDNLQWAFICPRCENKTQLQGHPDGFKDRPYRCSTCNWISLLCSSFIDEFAQECNTINA